MENRVWIILGIVASFFVGMNWGKITKIIKPYTETATQKVISGTGEAKKFLEEQKEKVRKGKKAELQPVSSEEGAEAAASKES